jgi:hypothetical protein
MDIIYMSPVTGTSSCKYGTCIVRWFFARCIGFLSAQSACCVANPLLTYFPSFFHFSLGGATATLFAFFAAIDPFFYSNNSPVYLYSFASPRVGGKKFRRAFKWLEERGKIRHARIHNMNDKVPHLPWMLGLYRHVGVQIRLDYTASPNIDYPIKENWFQNSNSYVEHIASSREFLKYHDCSEMFRRIKRAEYAFNSTSLNREYRGLWAIEDNLARPEPLPFPVASFYE